MTKNEDARMTGKFSRNGSKTNIVFFVFVLGKTVLRDESNWSMMILMQFRMMGDGFWKIS